LDDAYRYYDSAKRGFRKRQTAVLGGKLLLRRYNRPMNNRISDSRHTASATILIAGIALAAGCATMSQLEPPDVTLVDIRALEMTVFETTLEAKLRVSNPNPEPLALEGAAFKLYLDGKKVGSGMTPEVVEVPRLGSAVLKATVHINNASALLRLKDILEDRDVTYGLRGKLFVTRPNGTVRLKIEREGHLDLEGRLDLEHPLGEEPFDSVDVPGEDPAQP
jgi:LEA14-like dessication related protein